MFLNSTLFPGVLLTWTRPHNVHRFSIPRSPIRNGNRNGNEGTKLNIPPLKTEISLFRNDHEPRLQIAPLRKNYTRKRSVTTARVVLTLSSTGFGTEGGVRNSQVREDFERGKSPEQRDWWQEHCLKEPFRPMHKHLQRVLARKKRRNNSNDSLQTPSDQLPREVKSAQYRTVDYEIGLEERGSYMCKFKDGCKQEHLEGLLYST